MTPRAQTFAAMTAGLAIAAAGRVGLRDGETAEDVVPDRAGGPPHAAKGMITEAEVAG